MRKLFLIDGMALIYRSYYAFINNPLSTQDGFPTSAIYGFLNSTLKIIKTEKPDYITVALDAQKPTFRHKIFSDYKANRKKMPEELRLQIPEIKKILSQMNISTLVCEGFEADDIIATVTKKISADNLKIFIVTGDKDIMQLVDENVFVYSPGNKFSGTKIYNRESVIEKWNVEPNKICDLLSIMGDSSDNIPGVRGIGPKTASKLILEFENIDGLIQNVDNISNVRIRNLILDQIDTIKLSRKLVELKEDVELKFNLNEFDLKNLSIEKSVESLQKFELSSLLNLIGKKEKSNTSLNDYKKDYSLVTNLNHLSDLKTKLENSPIVSFKLETSDINPINAEIVGISFAIEQNRAFYIPVHIKKEIQNYDLTWQSIFIFLKSIMGNSNISFIGQNIKYDLIVLKNIGISVQNISFDTMIAAHLINPVKNSYSLDELCDEYLNYSKIKLNSLFNVNDKNFNIAELDIHKIKDYACENVDMVFQLKKILIDLLEKNNLIDLFEKIEIPFINVLVDLEKNGLYVDIQELKDISIKNKEKIDTISETIYSIAGKKFNINSTKQLAEILFDDMKLKPLRKRSTAVEVLEYLKKFHPLPEIILEYRHLNKLQTTYIDGIPKFFNEKTNRIHTSFNQTVASTGRLSSTKPNFQNIPIKTIEGKEIRRAFKPQNKGWKLISADYSQIELRIMAHFSKEKALIDAFILNEDVHKRTASLVYDVHIDFVTQEQRRQAKIVNYGILYGAGPFRMSQELNINMVQSKKLIENYFNTYSTIRSYIEETLLDAKEKGYVETFFGRRRNTADLRSSNTRLVNAEKRAAINMPIQGTASELIKVAMINIKNLIDEKKLISKLVLQVHDELIFEVPNDEEDYMIELIKKEMESSVELKVPIVVDCKSGKNWHEIH